MTLFGRLLANGISLGSRSQGRSVTQNGCLAMYRSSSDAARLLASRGLRRSFLTLILAAGMLLWLPPAAYAEPCGDSAIASIYGTGNVATISGQASGTCNRQDATPVSGQIEPYFTHIIACSTDRQAAAGGICSTTPCSTSGQFFAFRTIHYPGGSSAPTGFQCVTLNQATPTPGVTAAEVFAAIRRVKLPGGEIGAVPEVRGLANLDSFFFVRGATQPPVDLQVGGSVVHAEFRVVEYRWAFGDGQGLVTTGPGTAGLDSEVRTAFRRRGFYRVGVTVMWTAEAFLDGRRVGQVDDLASRARTTYPVAEVRTILTG